MSLATIWMNFKFLTLQDNKKMNTILDTRDLEEQRAELKKQILSEYQENFNADVDSYEDIDWENDHEGCANNFLDFIDR